MLRELLLQAIKDDDVRIVEFLVNNGADINDKDKYLHTPLYTAIIGSYNKSFCKLLELGANINVQNINGLSLLHCAVNANNELAVKALCKRGIDAAVNDMFGKNALDHAFRRGFKKLVNIIKKYNSRTNTIQITYEQEFDSVNLRKTGLTSVFSKFNASVEQNKPICIDHGSFGLASKDIVEIYIRKKPRC
jgi:ankyrin repeat protein